MHKDLDKIRRDLMIINEGLKNVQSSFREELNRELNRIFFDEVSEEDEDGGEETSNVVNIWDAPKIKEKTERTFDRDGIFETQEELDRFQDSIERAKDLKRNANKHRRAQNERIFKRLKHEKGRN